MSQNDVTRKTGKVVLVTHPVSKDARELLVVECLKNKATLVDAKFARLYKSEFIVGTFDGKTGKKVNKASSKSE